MEKICKVDGCGKPMLAKLLCKNHYQIEKRKTAGNCSVDACENSIKAKGLCVTHYDKLRSEGKPNCSIDGCKRKIHVKDMCNQHYIMWKKHGDPLAGAFRIPHKKAIDHGDGTRTCTKCEIRLPVNSFHKDKQASDGLRAMCKKCRIENVKDWYDKNRVRQANRELVRRRSNPEKYVKKEADRYERDKEKRVSLATEHSHLRRARRKERYSERGISKSALRKLHGTKCYYCQVEMDFSVGIGRKFNRLMATIEHIIPLAKGGEHTFENTVLACRHCNISKNAKSEEEFEEFKKNK